MDQFLVLKQFTSGVEDNYVPHVRGSHSGQGYNPTCSSRLLLSS